MKIRNKSLSLILVLLLGSIALAGGKIAILFSPFPQRAGPGTFAITGITGGLDSTTDSILDSGNSPTVSWGASAGASSYKVKILSSDGSTVLCAEASTTSTSYAFSSCTLTYGDYYTAQVKAINSIGGETTASNSPYTFWVQYALTNALGNVTPPVPAEADPVAVELGVVFKSTCDGSIKGVRFYRGAANSGGYRVNLWSSGGGNLATNTGSEATVPGWNSIYFSSPVALTKNTPYVVSYFASGGNYASGAGEFASALTSSCITLLSNSQAGGNGRYKYNASSAFPTDTYGNTNYYVDVIFQPSAQPPTIKGITGGSDVQLDDVLASGTNPTVSWTASPAAGSYDVTIYQNDGSTVQCAATNVSAPTVTAALSSCSLTSGTYYKASVKPRDSGGTLLGADSALFTFYVGSTTVLPVYPNYGSNWNDYVAFSSGSPYSQTDTTCVQGAYLSCLHAGEIRKVVTTKTSCTNLTVWDTLGAFDWVCDASGGNVTFYSVGLKSGKGLGDIVQASGWISNSVIVAENGTPFLTTSGSWWTNTVTALPDNSASSVTNLATSGTIYVLDSSRATTGYNINADKVALVIRPGASLSFIGSVKNCNTTTGETGSNKRCMIASGTQNYIWVEGSIDGQTTAIDYGIYLAGVKNGEIHGVTIDTTAREGIIVDSTATTTTTGVGVRSTTVKNVNASYDIMDLYGNGQYVEKFSGSGGLNGIGGLGSNTRLVNIRIANTASAGIEGSGSTGLIINKYIGSNTYGSGLRCYSCDNLTASMVTLTHVDGGGSYRYSGLLMTGSPYITFLGVSLLDTYQDNQFSLYDDDYFTGSNLLAAVDAQTNNISITGMDPGQFYDLAAYKGPWQGVDLNSYAGNNNVAFHGNLLIGNQTGTNCKVDTGQVTPGLVATTCANQGASDATYTSGIDLTSSYIGKVTSGDSTNTSDSSGSASYSATMDWLNFDNDFRGWGPDGAGWTSVTGICSSGTCRIWDWRLKSTDTVLKNRLGTAFVAGTTCPSAVNGNVTVTDLFSIPRTYLKNAYEIVGNRRLNPNGNNNGLCESGEACIYTPNMGTYQGEGDYEAAGTCTFQNGTVTGVQIYGYPTNGS